MTANAPGCGEVLVEGSAPLLDSVLDARAGLGAEGGLGCRG